MDGTELEGTDIAIRAHGNAFIYIHGAVTINGDYPSAILKADAGGTIFMEGRASFSGSATGRRYSCTDGSKILTGGKLDQLPGTIAGTCDEFSMVA